MVRLILRSGHLRRVSAEICHGIWCAAPSLGATFKISVSARNLKNSVLILNFLTTACKKMEEEWSAVKIQLSFHSACPWVPKSLLPTAHSDIFLTSVLATFP